MELTSAWIPGVCNATLVLAVAVEVVAVVAVVDVALASAVFVVAEGDTDFEAVVPPSEGFDGPMETCAAGPKMLVAAADRAVVAAGVLAATDRSTLLNGLLDAAVCVEAEVLEALETDTA